MAKAVFMGLKDLGSGILPIDPMKVVRAIIHIIQQELSDGEMTEVLSAMANKQVQWHKDKVFQSFVATKLKGHCDKSFLPMKMARKTNPAHWDFLLHVYFCDVLGKYMYQLAQWKEQELVYNYKRAYPSTSWYTQLLQYHCC